MFCQNFNVKNYIMPGRAYWQKKGEIKQNKIGNQEKEPFWQRVSPLFLLNVDLLAKEFLPSCENREHCMSKLPAALQKPETQDQKQGDFLMYGLDSNVKPSELKFI